MQKFGRLVCAIAAMLPFFGHAEFAYEFTATVNYKGTETLVDFPVLVRLPNVVTTHMREDGLDVRFFTADGATELEHECESFVRLEGALCWVKVPSLAEGTKLLVKCGDPDFDTPAAGASVWSSYIGVWHLDNVKTGTASAVDATGGTPNGTATGSGVKAVDGKVGTACQFINGGWTADNIGRITVANVGSLATDGKLTASWWMKPCNSGAMPRTKSKASYLLELREGEKNYMLWNVRYQMAVDAAPTFELQNYQDRSAGAQSVSVADADTKLNLPDWLHLAFTIEDDAEHTSATGAIWADAVLEAQGELNPLLSAGTGGKLVIGKNDGSGGDDYKGQMDEFRIRAAVSSADWIKAEHDSVDDVDFVKLPDDLAKVFCVTHRVVATEAEQTGDWADATVAGDDAWAAIQGVIDGCGVGDLILVKAGSYLLTNELAFASAELRGVTLRSDDGEGNLARKATLLVGGYPATSNRLVRIATPEVIVEGFTLTNGFVNAAPGGGAYLDNCGADAGLRSCDIVGCTAWNEAYLTQDVGFSNGTGGGAYVYNTGCISNCLFKSNVSFAGAVSLYGTQDAICPPKDTPWVTHCEFVWNEQIGKGTANNCNGSAAATRKACCIDHCSIVSNFCNVTGGVQLSTVGSASNGYLLISNCVFRANGLGKSKTMLLKTNSPSTIRCVGNTFIDETASTLIGCIDSHGSDGNSMINCSGALGATYVKNGFFYGNTSYSLGGEQVKLTVQNCTFVSNKGAIYSNGGGTTATRTNRVVNCLFFDNENDIYAINEGNATPIALFVSNCCIRASSLVRTGNHKFGLLVTNGCNIVYNGGQREYAARELIRFYANGRGDCHLRAGSALLGAGMTLGWMDGAVDLDGNPRVAGGAPDIGCYERQAGTIDPPLPCTRAVATEADKKDEWADAIVGLQAAVDAAYEDEPLYVKAGTYNVAEPITLKNQGVLLIGEGPGATIVDGGYPARTNRLFTVTQAGTRIRGMTLQNSAVAADGGAILVSHDDFTLDSCVVSNCCAGFNGKSEPARYGGGVYVDGVYPNVLLTNSLFVSCAARLGGGVAAWKKNTSLSAWATRETVPVVSDCELVANRVYADGSVTSGREGHGQGAGAFGSLWVEHSRFCGNFTKPTDKYATALALDSYAVVTNCIFEGHLSGECATIAGRGDSMGSQRSLITHCTFRGNSVPYLLMYMATVESCQVVSNAFTLTTALDALDNSTFKNTLFAYNTGVFGVGNKTYENCTFVTNEFGICLYVHSNAPTLRNCVSCGNTGTVSRIGSTFSGKADFCFERGWSANGKRTGTFEDNAVLGCRELPIYNGAAGATFDFCSLDKTDATSNIVAVVERRGFKFVDPANGNWRLRQNSPLRDAALTLGWMTDAATDLDGKPRRISSDGKAYSDSLPDIGCYECDVPKPGLLLMVW